MNKGCFLQAKQLYNNKTQQDLLIGDLTISAGVSIINKEPLKNFGLFYSSILTPSQACELYAQLFEPTKQFRLIFKASRDGFNASDFHKKCDQLNRASLCLCQVLKDESNQGLYEFFNYLGNI